MSMTASAAATGGGPGTEASSGAGTGLGFCRVTTVAPDSRIDVALPDDIPVADNCPEILRLSQQRPAEGAPVIVPRRGLTRFWGRFLEIAESFVLLTLVPLALAVFDVYATVRSMTS
ncbi:EsaB/YukD family protein [Streptomyces caeni]|uniref:EsaB/YukD family protein n=1 Tax=Streptomyces caeni TaxID=2307231 RepID=A0ABW4ITV4_9ACTN